MSELHNFVVIKGKEVPIPEAFEAIMAERREAWQYSCAQNRKFPSITRVKRRAV